MRHTGEHEGKWTHFYYITKGIFKCFAMLCKAYRSHCALSSNLHIFQDISCCKELSKLLYLAQEECKGAWVWFLTQKLTPALPGQPCHGVEKGGAEAVWHMGTCQVWPKAGELSAPMGGCCALLEHSTFPPWRRSLRKAAWPKPCWMMPGACLLPSWLPDCWAACLSLQWQLMGETAFKLFNNSDGNLWPCWIAVLLTFHLLNNTNTYFPMLISV